MHGDIDAAALARDQVDKFLNESDKNNAVFLGDYFNKKTNKYDDKSFEVLEIITDLQIKYNNRVVLLRGNHEESYINFENFEYCGNFTSGTNDYITSAELIDEKIKELNSTQIKDFCNSLPIAAEITNKNQRVLCLHGFIPSAKNDYTWLDTLRKEKSSDISSDIKFPLLCNYYSESQQDETKDRGIRKVIEVDCVCNDTLKKFLENNNYKCLIRGHSHNEFSEKDIFGNGTCYSVHSNPNDFFKANSESPTAGILLFDNNGEIKTKIEYKYCNKSYGNSKINNLVEVPSRKDSIDETLKENNEKIIAVSPEKFKKIIKNYRGALIFRGCYFENEQSAKNYENILFSDIKKSISTNKSPSGDGIKYVYFAHNVYRALRYATSASRTMAPLSRVYLAYHIDDTVNDYSENDSVAKNTNDNLVICNEPFELNRLIEKNDVTNLGNKTFGWFRECYPHIEKNIKTWVKECIGEKATENLWSYFLDDIKIEF